MDNNQTKNHQSNFCCIKQMAQTMIHKPNTRPMMTEWYSPKQLIKTGIKVLLSTVFGQYSDSRLIEAYDSNRNGFVDFSKEYLQNEEGKYITDEEGFYLRDQERDREDIWIDYVSDLGDGFNSTYTIAYYLSSLKLKLENPQSKEKLITSRGDILIFGGDQVYPVPSKQKYMERLVTPYHLALGYTTEPHPQVFAIPGNHDWFDGRQVQYFKDIAKEMQDGDRVILCNAKPYWMSTEKEKKDTIVCDENNLLFLEKLLHKHIQIFIAGDKHHYRRFEHIPNPDKVPDHSLKIEKITAGGGGAFLHPTHNLRKQHINEYFLDDCGELEKRTFERKKDFPNEQDSRKLCRGNLLFLLKNKSFGLITALLYLFISSPVLRAAPAFSEARSFGEFFIFKLSAISDSPKSIFWTLVIIAGFWLLADGHSRRFKYLIGCLHGLCHVSSAFIIAYSVVYMIIRSFNFEWNFGTIVLSGLLVAAGGWIFGSIIMGLYLYISLNVFGYHGTEAFSSLKIENWKNFLRIHIDKDGNLTIYPIGIEKIVQRWKPTSKGKTDSLLEPEMPGNDKIPKLIESPIVIPPINHKNNRNSSVNIKH